MDREGNRSEGSQPVPQGNAEMTAGGDALVPTPRAEETSAAEPNAAVRQLDSILQNLSSFATPVLRQIAARAAEVAARAADAAGPVAQRAAELTDEVGGRLAAKSREIASDLRKEPAADTVDSGSEEAAANRDHPAGTQ